MHVVHLLRKCDPAEWGGTEMAMQRLFAGLREHGVVSVVHCPLLRNGDERAPAVEPLASAGCLVRRYHALVPIWGLSRPQRLQYIAVGGNLISFDLIRALWKEPGISLIHTHTLGRLGGIAGAVARRRGIPLVVTIHGGLLDLPAAVQEAWREEPPDGLDWGRLFGLLLQSRRLLDRADAILTCNPKEAWLLQQQHPGRLVQVQPHGVPMALYQTDQRAAARADFPQLDDRPLLLCVGRIDPVKNQGWLLSQAAEIFQRHPRALLCLAGGCTNEAYGRHIQQEIERNSWQDRVILAGNLPPGDPRLIGLYQLAHAVVLPSISETFGLVILEAWAAGTAVIASRTSGATALIRHGENGWLMDLNQPSTFHEALARTLASPDLRTRLVHAGRQLIAAEYNVSAVAARMKRLYEHLLESNHALRHSSRR